MRYVQSPPTCNINFMTKIFSLGNAYLHNVHSCSSGCQEGECWEGSVGRAGVGRAGVGRAGVGREGLVVSTPNLATCTCMKFLVAVNSTVVLWLSWLKFAYSDGRVYE
jgi:hypothetical protein